jgi:hypothetical protein
MNEFTQTSQSSKYLQTQCNTILLPLEANPSFVDGGALVKQTPYRVKAIHSNYITYPI